MARTQHVRYLVMVPNYWGIGDTVDDAVEELLAAGGYIGDGYTILEFADDVIFQSVHPVFGEVSFSHRDGETQPEQPKVFPVTPKVALYVREQAITKALVNEDIDADIAEELREERDGIREDLKALA